MLTPIRRSLAIMPAPSQKNLSSGHSTDEETTMAKRVLDADTILNRAKPLTHQQAFEIQPYGHIVKLPIALAENVCKESVENLNQLLADTMTLRDLYKKHHWQVAGPT